MSGVVMHSQDLRYAADRLPESWFMGTLLAALGLHVLIFIAWNFVPKSAVDLVPVRVLNIKLGGGEALGLPGGGGAPLPRAEMEQSGDVPNASAEAAVKALEHSMTPSLPGKFVHKNDGKISRSATAEETRAGADDGRPVKYVREGAGGGGDGGGGPGGVGSPYGNSADAEAVILERYEQLISGWIEQHKTYPPEARQAGIEGRAVVRLRINRLGRVILFSIEKSSGSPVLDRAAEQMIRAANPVPRVPNNYPAGRLLEFLIPVEFKLH